MEEEVAPSDSLLTEFVCPAHAKCHRLYSAPYPTDGPSLPKGRFELAEVGQDSLRSNVSEVELADTLRQTSRLGPETVQTE